MKKIILYFFAASMLVLVSCKDFLNMPPKNVRVVYKLDDVRLAMSTFLYCTLYSYSNSVTGNSVVFNGQRMFFPYNKYGSVMASIYSDDMELVGFVNESSARPDREGRAYKSDYMESRKWEGYQFSNRMWNRVFHNVGYLNAVLRDLSNVPDYEKTIGEQISGEARVIRAYYLLRLNQLFAPYNNNNYGIPYNLDADVFSGGPRHKQTDLYKELIGELMDVLEYETLPKKNWNLFFNKRVIYGILAQTYMYKAESCAKESDDWANAEKYAKMARENNEIENTVDAQTELALLPTDAILEIPSQYCLIRFSGDCDSGNSGSNVYSPWGTPDALAQQPSEELYAMYDKDDIRVPAYFKERDGKPYIAKNNLREGGDIDAINVVTCLFRYSDLMLIEAEAMVRQNKAGAVELLNTFKRAKIPSFTGYTGNDVLGEILKERRKEFCYEQQMRWLDMKRLGVSFSRKSENLDTKEIETYTLAGDDYRYTLPIPAEMELTYNKVEQNPGWNN